MYCSRTSRCWSTSGPSGAPPAARSNPYSPRSQPRWATRVAPPCRKVKPLLAEIAAEMGDKVEFVKLNIDENPETAMVYRVMSVPTLTIFKGGQPVQSVAGAKPKGDL